MSSDLIFTNARVITVDKDFSICQAIAVKDGKITAVGTNEEIAAFTGSGTRVLDLKGKPILPGINDSHMHASFFGASQPPFALDLGAPEISSIQKMVKTLEKKVAETEPGKWIQGFGWAQDSLLECKKDSLKLPRKHDIDAVSPDNPVALLDFSGHTLLVNSKALEIAGITRETTDPRVGEMERDPLTGEPTGIFKEAMDMIFIHIPPPSREESTRAILTTLAHLNANGVTSYTDAGIEQGDVIDIYNELLDTQKLTARVNVLMLPGNPGELTQKAFKQYIKTFKMPTETDNTRLKFSGIKLFADGVPMTYTSWMNEDYVSGDAGHGRSVMMGDTDEEQRNNLIELIKYAHMQGYQIGVHASGDRAIDAVVDGFIMACEKNSGNNLRHYVIHGENISQEKAEALANINCGIAMQPFIKAMTSDFIPLVLGEERAARQWPMRTALLAGVNLTGSSDAPCSYPNWRKGIQAAVLREGLDSGKVSGPEECISVEEAIRIYTINGAWQDHMEDIKGSIEPGKVADFCVIGEDILTVDPRKIGRIPVLMTIVGGEIVFNLSDNSVAQNIESTKHSQEETIMENTDKNAVQAVIQKYIDGTFNGDADALRSCFHPKAVMNGFLNGQLLMGGPEPFFEEMEKNPSMKEGGAPYKGEITYVDVAGEVAVVTLKETGFAGTMSFTDYFHLLKEDGTWRIISKAFTTE